MPTDIIMPKLGLTMEEGTVVRWHAAEGERVEQGQVLLEVETDKVTVDVEAAASGVMGPVLVGAGLKVPVGALLARLYAGGEPIEETTEVVTTITTTPPKESVVAASAGPPARMTPLARRMAERAGVDLAAVATSGLGGRVTAEDVQVALRKNLSSSTGPAPTSSGVRVFSSPRARKQAGALGLDWRELPGSGPRGRVIERDVLRAALGSRAAEPSRPAAEHLASAGVRWETPTAVGRIVAERMTASFGSAPHFYLNVEVLAEALLDLHGRLLPIIERRAGVRLTLTDLLARIAGAALAEHPRANAFWDGGRIGIHERVNIGIAVTTDAGLVVPILRDVDRKSLTHIAAERAGLVEKARAGRLAPDDLAGGTFTLTNLGMYRVDSFQAILNPPQSAILAVGRIAERPAAVNGQLVVRTTAVLTLSCDHRVLDGAAGAGFLGRVAELIEEPYGLLA
jgi:pyruvate dehydrogenase E2 component (dihydrolipoamide acetyltransferase)